MTVTDTDFLAEYRIGSRARRVISLAVKDERMTTDELVEILTGDLAGKLGYRRALRHKNAPAPLVKKLSRDGEFMHKKCLVYWWDEATADELHAGAKWMVTNAAWSCDAAAYADHPHTGAQTLTYLYNNVEDGGYLWSALLTNPNTPDDVRDKLQKRMTKSQIRDINYKIAELKKTVTQLKGREVENE